MHSRHMLVAAQARYKLAHAMQLQAGLQLPAFTGCNFGQTVSRCMRSSVTGLRKELSHP